MKIFVCAILVGLFCFPGSSVTTEITEPRVQVYSHAPGELGRNNTLICHVSGFYPPQIEIELLKNEKEMPSGKQTDLAFDDKWHYHLTKHVPFTPNKGEDFVCRVTHMGKSRVYTWEPDM